MRKRISIMLASEVVDDVDMMVTIQRKRTLQGEDPINRSRFIERAVLDHLEKLK